MRGLGSLHLRKRSKQDSRCRATNREVRLRTSEELGEGIMVKSGKSVARLLVRALVIILSIAAGVGLLILAWRIQGF